MYADEFHNIVTETFESLLSEARKYGLALTMAHQYVSQLSPKVQAAVFGNAGSIVVFRISGEDAEKMEPELAPIFKVKDMINLGKQEFYIKMTIDGESYDPFSAATLKVMPPAHQSYRDRIVEASRKKYTVHVDTAKKLILEEEAGILRSASEKGIIEGKRPGGPSVAQAATDAGPQTLPKEEPKDIEPLI